MTRYATFRNYGEVGRKACLVERLADVTVELETRRDRDDVRTTGTTCIARFHDAMVLGANRTGSDSGIRIHLAYLQASK